MNTQGMPMVLLFALVMGLSTHAAGAGQRPDLPVAAAESHISRERAGEIALEQVGGGTIAQAEFRFKKDGRREYEVLVVDGDTVVKVKIDAVRGQVMSLRRKNIESVKYSDKWSGGAFDAQGGIDAARAREIALAKTGGGTIIEVEKDFKKDGRIVYEVEVVNPERKYEIKIDALNGNIIEYKEKMPRHPGPAYGRG